MTSDGSPAQNDAEESRAERHRSLYTWAEERYGWDAPTRAEAEADR